MKLTTRPLSVLPAATVRATCVRGRTIVVDPDPVFPELVTVVCDGALELLPVAAAGALELGLDTGAELLAAVPAEVCDAVPSAEEPVADEVEPADAVEVEEPEPEALAAELPVVLGVPVALGSVVPVAGVIGGIAGPGAAGVLPLGEVELAAPGWVTPATGADVGVPASPELRYSR